MAGIVRVEVTTRSDVERARRDARSLAIAAGFSSADAECVALAVSELATNLERYAREGVIQVQRIGDGPVVGVEIEARDAGPGIQDLDSAMRDGFSTGTGLGSGLPAVRRLMDTFEINSDVNGTTIIARKWITPTPP